MSQLKTFRQLFYLREDTAPDLNRLDQMLKDHDWYFSYSDDFRVWKKGEEEHKKIMDMVKKLGKDGKKLYNKYIKKLGV